jgi:hypothetical protein
MLRMPTTMRTRLLCARGWHRQRATGTRKRKRSQTAPAMTLVPKRPRSQYEKHTETLKPTLKTGGVNLDHYATSRALPTPRRYETANPNDLIPATGRLRKVYRARRKRCSGPW